MNESWKKKLKRHWEEDPLRVIAVGSGAAIAAVAVLNAVSQARSRNAYAKAVNYRVKNERYPYSR